jgi:transcriptional regulator with XRE-family HTH domain
MSEPSLKFDLARLDQAMAQAGYRSDLSATKAAGVGPDFIRMLRSGKVQSPGADKLCALARILGVTVEWLMGGEANAFSPPTTPWPPEDEHEVANRLFGMAQAFRALGQGADMADTLKLAAEMLGTRRGGCGPDVVTFTPLDSRKPTRVLSGGMEAVLPMACDEGSV